MMELDEIKSAWAALDNRLRKNEALEERIIKEMLHKKAKRSLNKLTNYEMFGLVASLLLLPFLVFMYVTTTKAEHVSMTLVACYMAFAITAVALAFSLSKVVLLMKMNLAKNVSKNIELIQRYNLFIKREKLFMFVTICVFLVVCVLGLMSLNKVEAWRWAAVIVALFVFPVAAYWQYKKVYDANIQSITNSLDELRELEEEK